MQAMQTNLCASSSAIEQLAVIDQQQLWIKVSDQGTGIEGSMADTLVLAFASNKHTGKTAGMGLGPTLVRPFLKPMVVVWITII